MTRKITKRPWTDDEVARLQRDFPNVPSYQLARDMGRGLRSLYQKAYQLGLRKSDEFFASGMSGRMNSGRGEASRFKKGQRPWNKGTRWLAGGRSTDTQFKPGTLNGRAAEMYKPVGSERVNYCGHLERKVTDDPTICSTRRWVPVHRLVWEAAHGPIPPKHVVAFKPGRFSTNADEITPDALELLTMRENMARNSRHNRYPPEVNQLIQLRGALNRKIKNRSKTA